MAHTIQGRIGRLRAAGSCVLGLAAATAALALDVGEPRVRSAIGEPLDASLPVRANPGERFAGKCFSVAPGAGLPEDPQLGVTLERSRGRANLRVRTGKSIEEPAVGLKVGVDCEQSGKPLKDVPLLIDLPTRPRAAPPPAAQPETARPATPREAPELPGAASELPKAPSPVARPAPRPPRAAAPAVVPAKPAAIPAPPASHPVTTAAPPPSAVAATPSRAPSAGFQLKLTTGEMDLAPSRRIDDRQREQLRGRLALLDADDQLSTMLAMRHQLQQLETKVAALQLKLAQMPESFPPPKAAVPVAPAKPAPVVEAPKPAPAVEVPKPAPVVEAPKPAPVVEAPKPVPVVEAPKPAPVVEVPKPAPVVEAPKPAPETPKPKAGGPRPASPPQPGGLEDLWSAIPGMAWVLMGLLAAFLALGWWWRHRRGASVEEEALPVPEPEAVPDEFVAVAPSAEMPLGEIAAPIEIEPPSSIEAASVAPATPAPAAVPLESLPDDAASLRQRYIAERFPEVTAGSIDLADPESVIKGARLFYEDGELPRAVELLQYTIENDPDEPRPWLALFEIFRLERLGGEFSQLAARFRERFRDSEHWNKVRFFGREVDPGNALYRDEAPASLETIGPREARRLAAANATYDPITENWLRAPMDFQNEVLATELRRALMADAALTESDLVPNPMPALRDIEMFTVA